MTCPPPARDGRMDRDAEDAPGGTLGVVVVPGLDGTPADASALQPWGGPRTRRLLAAGAVAIVVLTFVAGLTVSRSLAYQALLEENRALKESVRRIDERMGDVDRLLLRLRMYDAQLRSLRPDGEAGPFPDADGRGADPDGPGPGDLGGFPEPAAEGHPTEGELRPAEAWADSVVARADHFLSVFAEAEPTLNALVDELEDLRALERALPGVWPATGRLTSGYGYRASPIFRRRTQFHKGIDIANRRGSAIRAAAPGVVLRSEYVGGYGYMVELDHGFGITTVYAHCSRLKVRRGDEVEAGQLIATMGASGQVTGTHLHFEVRIDGHAVDPLDYLPR